MRDKNEECNCGVAARSRDTTEPCPVHAEPVAAPAGELVDDARQPGGPLSRVSSPAIGDVFELFKAYDALRLKGTLDYTAFDTVIAPLVAEKAKVEDKLENHRKRANDNWVGIDRLKEEVSSLRAKLGTAERGEGYWRERHHQRNLEVIELQAKLERARDGLLDMATDERKNYSPGWFIAVARATLEELND